MTIDELKCLAGEDSFFSDEELREMDLQVENGSAFRMTDYTDWSKKIWREECSEFAGNS